MFMIIKKCLDLFFFLRILKWVFIFCFVEFGFEWCVMIFVVFEFVFIVCFFILGYDLYNWYNLCGIRMNFVICYEYRYYISVKYNC